MSKKELKEQALNNWYVLNIYIKTTTEKDVADLRALLEEEIRERKRPVFLKRLYKKLQTFENKIKWKDFIKNLK